MNGSEEVPDYGPCDWVRFDAEMRHYLGEDTMRFFEFCQLIDHLGREVKRHVIWLFKEASGFMAHHHALERLTTFIKRHHLFTRGAKDMPTGLLKQEMTKSVCPALVA